MKKPYLTYALSAEGKLVHIDSVANGKECGCFCTYCGEPLQAKQGAKRKHHFLIYQELNVKLLMSQCFTCWQKRKYRKLSIIEHHFI